MRVLHYRGGGSGGSKAKPFFGGLVTLPQRGGGVACLPFWKLWVPSSESPPPPVGVGQEWVGILGGEYL